MKQKERRKGPKQDYINENSWQDIEPKSVRIGVGWNLGSARGQNIEFRVTGLVLGSNYVCSPFPRWNR